MFRTYGGRLGASAFLLLFGISPLCSASISDFQARLAQTIWCVAQTEAIVRSLPESSTPVPVPEGLGSYLVLVSENVNALTASASMRATDEQRRILAEGLKATARNLRDQVSLANNRGLTAAASVLSQLESSCRAAAGEVDH